MISPELLLIDDDVESSVLRKRVLETHGYRVQLALDGACGLALAKAMRPALVILDYALPSHSGPEILLALKQELPAMPVISLSGYEDLAAQYGQAPPDAFLTKGDGARQMLRTVAELLPCPLTNRPSTSLPM